MKTDEKNSEGKSMQKEKMRLVTCVLITCVALIVLMASCGNRSAKGEAIVISNASMEAVQMAETYTVQPGDTLLEIAEQYIRKETYSSRPLNVFAESIKEANPRAFVNGNYVRAGEVLIIRYWVRRGK